MAKSEPLWQPNDDRIVGSNLHRFMATVADQTGLKIDDYRVLHNWSITDPSSFWRHLVDFSNLRASTWGERELVDGEKMPGARWFPDAKLNFAENMLRRCDESDAIVFWGESGLRKQLSWRNLNERVAILADVFRDFGIKPGDRIAGFMPNVPETVIWFLATASVGAIWSSCSPDFGVDGVLDRFGQIKPRILVACDGYFYNGTRHEALPKLSEILGSLPTIEKCVVVPYASEKPSLVTLENTILFDEFVAGYSDCEISFEQLPFSHPLYILYSSGTTGRPKCIVHSAGGALLTHVKEHQLHCDVKPGDRVFYFTTCGWMMWNWLVSALASKATLVLYDGAPFHPDGNILFDYTDAAQITLFGTSPKFIDALSKAALSPIDTHDLSSLRTITSTGSPLAPESFDYVYRAIKHDVHLASIAGGTDIVGCFVAGVPTEPVWRGEIQGPALAMATAVFDESGHSRFGQKGELVCTKPFPSMPVRFWNDSDGARYHAAYFNHFPGIWRHGDWAEVTLRGSFIIHGRSDATLNAGGVRIGTAEIYRQVEQLDEVIESVAIGQAWERDIRIVLFVILRPSLVLNHNLTKKIKERLRKHCSPRHVPARIVAVKDIPRTKSGKISELAVRDVVHGRHVENAEALANPETLDFFKDVSELRT